jgi:hypothetical protein
LYFGSGKTSLFLTSPLRGILLYFGFFAPYLERPCRLS